MPWWETPKEGAELMMEYGKLTSNSMEMITT